MGKIELVCRLADGAPCPGGYETCSHLCERVKVIRLTPVPPSEMARERTQLIATLEGIGMWNTYGKTVDELSEVALEKIETEKRLFEVDAEIRQYVEGR